MLASSDLYVGETEDSLTLRRCQPFAVILHEIKLLTEALRLGGFLLR